MHLDLASLYHCAVQLIPCPVSIGAICEGYKTKSLHARQCKNKEACIIYDKSCKSTKHFFSSSFRLIIVIFLADFFVQSSITCLFLLKSFHSNFFTIITDTVLNVRSHSLSYFVLRIKKYFCFCSLKDFEEKLR